MEQSGAVIAWRHFFDSPIPRVLLRIEDRDLWRFALPETKATCAGLRAIGVLSDFRKLKPCATMPLKLDEVTMMGEASLSAEAEIVASQVERAKPMWIRFGEQDTLLLLPVVNATTQFSETADALLRGCDGREWNCAAYWFRDYKRGVYQVGMRSRNGVDCSVKTMAV